jgi:DNA primase
LDWWDKHQDQLDDSLVLPLTTPLGQIGGLQFRHVQQSRKGYTDFMAVKDEACLFGLSQAMPSVWEYGAILLVEGAFDFFPVQRHIPFATATLHAGISNAFWRVLRRVASQIYLAYDADKTGWDQSKKISEHERAQAFDVKIIRLPRVPIKGTLKYTKDPSELWETWGDSRLGVFLTQQLAVHQQETLSNARF